ncbi:MAG: DUF1294 domain-containing protein [Gemmataceae bacterium]
MARSMRPEWRHGLTALAACAALTLVFQLSLRLPWTWYHLLAGWLVAVNAVTFGYYGYDKGQAQAAGPRVPEAVLHGLAVAGGTGGAYAGMRTFRHKTVKGSFRVFFWAVAVMQGLLLVAAAYRVARG